MSEESVNNVDPRAYDEEPGIDGADMVPQGVSITGGEGHGSGNARQLVVIQRLTDRSGNTPQERIALMDSDMREACAAAAIRLNNEAMKYSVQGFEWDLNDIQYTHAGVARTITATLRIAR